MDEKELEAIRRRKLEELQRHAVDREAQEEVAAQAQAQRQTILRQILRPEARERLGRITLAYPDLAQDIENRLIALAQSGRIDKAIDDASLRQILRAIIPKKREINIERR
ncbi:MAG: DNA-binding protein [Candidatus Thermoplasmatota archaeon]|nr:DNA-binding protein [Candidatus Thermoplasmatota archaeon]